MSISAQNTGFKGYIRYKVFAAIGELGDIVAFDNIMRVPFLPLAGSQLTAGGLVAYTTLGELRVRRNNNSVRTTVEKLGGY